MTEPNEFTEALSAVGSSIPDLIAEEEEIQDNLTTALTALFQTETDKLDMPDDEDEGNLVMMQAIIALMDRSFKAGMIYHASFERTGDDDTPVIPISSEQATQIVLGLMGTGFTLRVDRG